MSEIGDRIDRFGSTLDSLAKFNKPTRDIIRVTAHKALLATGNAASILGQFAPKTPLWQDAVKKLDDAATALRAIDAATGDASEVGK